AATGEEEALIRPCAVWRWEAPRALGAGVALVALVAAGCSNGAHAAAPHGSPSVVSSPAPPPAGNCPLTDLAPPTGVSVSRPVLAVKVDDSIPAADPQAGLDQADIVYDEPIEGNLDWFLALFQCGNPSSVGPVREAEIEDPSILSQYGSVLYAYASDVPAAVSQSINQTAEIVSVNSGHDGPAYSRSGSHPAPYNLFADPSTLRSSAVVTATTFTAPSPQFEFRTTQAPTPAPSPAASQVSFSLGPTVSYKYDPQSNAYLRFENGNPMMAASGNQITVANVVIVWTQINMSSIIDGAGNAEPLPVLTGQGQAMVLTGGKEYDGQWTRSGVTQALSLVDSSGKPVPFTPGNTWIHILPISEAAYVS
ncbi:MAG TPA: DUF3048 C-terminal domain-containing protein, partial [Actinomycetota bacterium]|nr:DUF3048 C-terminal domain-containing protein [Actinomycetota bacterium]